MIVSMVASVVWTTDQKDQLCEKVVDRETGKLGYDEDVEDEINRMLEAESEEAAEISLILNDSGPGAIRRVMDIDVKPSEYTEFAIFIPTGGKIERFSFADRPYLVRPYDTPSHRLLLKTARQVEKSTLLSNVSMAYTNLIVAFKVLYVTVTAQQATVFSVDRLRETIDSSPVISSLTSTKLAQNVFFKQFRNRSLIRVRYAFLSAGRTRGISSDMILIDELQDIMTENIPIIEQCASHSPWKIYRYSGTPLSFDNTIEVYWDRYSTQNEWMVPCDHHTPKHWNCLGERNIGKKGPICMKCGAPIDPLGPGAKWVSLQPVTDANASRVTFEGYRIPQLMVPWIIRNEHEWRDKILFAMERYSRAQFYNEVLGLSYDSGSRPLTRLQVESCCDDSIDMTQVARNASRCAGGVFVGIDWGLGDNASFTVLTLGGYIRGVFTIFYVHRFTGQEAEPLVQLEMIAKIIGAIGFHLAGCDYGIGFDRNDWLARNFGPIKIKKYQYVGRLKQKVKWEPKLNRFVVHRTEVMSDIFNAIRAKKIRFPRKEQFAPYAEDILNIFSEYSEPLRMVLYKVSPGKSDDTFHSIVYCFLASMIEKPRRDILMPVKE